MSYVYDLAGQANLGHYLLGIQGTNFESSKINKYKIEKQDTHLRMDILYQHHLKAQGKSCFLSLALKFLNVLSILAD